MKIAGGGRSVRFGQGKMLMSGGRKRGKIAYGKGGTEGGDGGEIYKIKINGHHARCPRRVSQVLNWVGNVLWRRGRS